jgi:hypothetical protein
MSETSEQGYIKAPLWTILRGGKERAEVHPWDSSKEKVLTVPVRTPRKRIKADSGLPETTKHLEGTCQDPLKSQWPPPGGYSATLWVFDPLGPDPKGSEVRMEPG